MPIDRAGAPAPAAVRVIGFVGDSGSGKTTLVTRLIERFVGEGRRVAAVKHAHHGFDIDRPGKDSYRFRSAGAVQVLVASDQRWVLMGEEPEADPARALARQLARLDPCDLILVEGYRGQAGIPFIEVRRSGLRAADGAAALAPRPPPPGRVAIAADKALAADRAEAHLPRLDLDDIAAVARFITVHLALPPC